MIKKISLFLTAASIFSSGLDLFASATATETYIDFRDQQTLTDALKEQGDLRDKNIYIRCSTEQAKELGSIISIPENVGLEIDIAGIEELNLGKKDIPAWVKRLRITNKDQRVTKIGDNFLKDCDELIDLDLVGLNNVTEIKDNFLMDCGKLINLALMSNVNKIGNNFIVECHELEKLDLEGLRNVTELGDYFLSGAEALEELDLEGLRNVTRIGKRFLASCENLQNLNLTPLNNVTELGGYFLSGAEALQNLDLTPLEKVARVGDGFLEGSLTRESFIYTGAVDSAVAQALEKRFDIEFARGG